MSARAGIGFPPAPTIAGRLRRRAWREWYRWTSERRLRSWHDRVVRERVAGLDLEVWPGVFNPKRLRTGAVLASFLDGRADLDGLDVLDLGTGSGVGALSAARRGARVAAVDTNPLAVRCARINASLNGLESRTQIIAGDLFGPVGGRRFDRVVFNPPYWREPPRSEYDRSFRSLDVLDRFAVALPAHLKPGGVAWVLVSSDGVGQDTLGRMTACGLTLGVLDTVDLGNEIVAILEVVPNRVEVATA
ncbi:MAG: methyltransferase [Vicinamibacterales bacterium]